MVHNYRLIRYILQTCKTCLVVSIFLAGMMGLLAQSDAVSAQTLALLRWEPGMQTLGVGGVSEVLVWVENVEDLYTMDIHVEFNPDVVEVLRIENGGFLDTGFIIRQEIDSTTGTAWFVMTQLNPSTPKTGSGALLRLLVRGRSHGDSVLRITQATLVNINIKHIEFALQDGVVFVDGALPTATLTPTPTVPTVTPTPTETSTQAPTMTFTPTSTPTLTPSLTPTATRTPTGTLRATTPAFGATQAGGTPAERTRAPFPYGNRTPFPGSSATGSGSTGYGEQEYSGDAGEGSGEGLVLFAAPNNQEAGEDTLEEEIPYNKNDRSSAQQLRTFAFWAALVLLILVIVYFAVDLLAGSRR